VSFVEKLGGLSRILSNRVLYSIQKMIYYILVMLILMKASHGVFTVAKDKDVIEEGDTVKLTCHKDSSPTSRVAWENERYAVGAQTFCEFLSDSCFPNPSGSDARYTFSSNYMTSDYFMTISNITSTDSGTYTCKDDNEAGTFSLVVPTPKGGSGDSCTVKEWWFYFYPCVGAPLYVIGIILIIIPWISECIKNGEIFVRLGSTLFVVGTFPNIIGLGGALNSSCTYWWMIVCLVVAVIIILGRLYQLGYLPGRWSDTVLIPEKDYPRIKFEDVLSWVKRKKIMEETQAQIFICGEGMNKYENPGGQDACLCLKSLPDDDQPLQAYVTACLKISVKRAVLKIKELHEAFTTQSVIAAVHEPTYKAVNSVEPREASLRDITTT